MLLWIERVLLGAGVTALLWCGYVVGDASLVQQHARRTFVTAPRIEISTPSASPPPAAANTPIPLAEVPTIRRSSPVATGAPLAELSIPSVHLSTMVLQGSDARTLREGPGHLEHTAWPGENGNLVIAGHRDSFFRPLRNIHIGDDIFLTTPEGRVAYRVSALWVRPSTDVSVLERTTDPILTLITCYPFWFVGPAQDRFVVRATRVITSAQPLAARSLALPQPIIVPAAGAGPIRTEASTPDVLDSAEDRR